jgi:hypothetical protein
MNKRYSAVYLLIALFLILVLLYAISQKYNLPKIPFVQKAPIATPTSTPAPTPFIFRSYTAPIIEKKQVYKIVMVGDSMTAALGPHGGGLSDYMNSLYKKIHKILKELSLIIMLNQAISWP